MGISEIREPIQKRSIEKKEKIIKEGFELICDKGYYNTNTAEIAKAAGVSTGIVYQYFNDKHDILLEGIKTYANSIFYPMFAFQKKNFDIKNFDIILRDIILKFIDNHKLSKVAHEEITSMIHSDKEVSKIFQQYEIEITNEFTNFLLANNVNSENLKEKVHISINLIDDVCHEIVYHKHKNMNYNIMIDIVVEMITKIIK